jgi:hypothetical protein
MNAQTPRYTVKSEANRQGYETHTIWDTVSKVWAWSYYAAEDNGMGGTHERPQFFIFPTARAAQVEADRLNAQYARRWIPPAHNPANDCIPEPEECDPHPAELPGASFPCRAMRNDIRAAIAQATELDPNKFIR